MVVVPIPCKCALLKNASPGMDVVVVVVTQSRKKLSPVDPALRSTFAITVKV